MEQTPQAAHPFVENIDTVANMEEAALRSRTGAERAADSIGSFVGSIPFVLLNIAVFAGWAAVNTGVLAVIPRFDPFPFQLLCMLVSMEGVLLSAFVLMKQNRMGSVSERRAHLDLQINLLTEREVTRLLQIVEMVARRMGIEESSGALGKDTEVGHLVRELDRKLATGSDPAGDPA